MSHTTTYWRQKYRIAVKYSSSRNPTQSAFRIWHLSWTSRRYYDEQTMAFVMKRDKYIMEKFGYETCCPEDDADSEPEKKAEL